MRSCCACSSEDRPWFDEAPCSCGAYIEHDDDPSPLKHDASCKSLGHEVVMYPVRVARADLTHDLKLGSYYAQRGWKLMQNGQRWYRCKMLCRPCIEIENGAQARRQEYERACKEARGIDNASYSQMIAQQSMI
jgi:hypothetical protein